MEFEVIEILSFGTIVLTGVFGIYGLLHDYKDEKGKLTKHGKVAIYGIAISLVLSTLGFAIKLKQNSDERKEKLGRIQDELDHQQVTIGKLDSLVRDIQRLNYPLSDLQIELSFLIDSTSSSVRNFHSKVRETLNSIESGQKSGYTNSSELRAIYNGLDKSGPPVRIHARRTPESSFFPRMEMQTSSIGLFRNRESLDSLNLQQMIGFSSVFRTPSKGMPQLEIHEEILEFYLQSGKYLYSIKYTPLASFANTKINSHLDLKSVFLGFGIRNHISNWKLQKVSFRHSLGLITTYSNIEVVSQKWPSIKYLAKPD